MRRLLLALLLAVVGCASCCQTAIDEEATQTTAVPPATEPSTVRLLFVGDLMLGRRVSPVLASEGPGVFEGARFVVSSADVAAANLESPLTDLPHRSEALYALEADPRFAALLAGAGFDLVSLANNHSGDAGPQGLLDTMRALHEADIGTVGAGVAASEAVEPAHMTVNGVHIAQLAFDVTGVGLEPGDGTPGVARYEGQAARLAVEEADSVSDVVAVSIHGGVEYLTDHDPILEEVGKDLVDWGADIVWGHGPHVPQPVSVTDAGEVVATSLGNFIFDQQRPLTQTGLILEVLASRDGVEAFRVGRVDHADLRAEFVGWDEPEGTAALIDGDWWSLTSTPEIVRNQATTLEVFPLGFVVDADLGDITGDGKEELVVSYRHPFRPNEVNSLYPDLSFSDSSGQSAHLGIVKPETLDPVWAAGTLLRPVADLAACDGGIALAFDGLEDPTIVATSAWLWWDYGFATAPELPGPGTPTCIDVDRDGHTDPVILRS